jgi:hypothetical protein
MQRFSQVFFRVILKKSIAPLFILISLTGMAQDGFLNTVTTNLSQYESTVLMEKIYLQTDKSLYISGEICWFKSYIVDASLHKPFSLSKVAYVEVLNRDSKPVLQGKILLEKGIGSGSFFIPLSLPSGSYKIRAYTNWMKNQGPEYFFEKNITIVNTQKRDRDSIVQKIPAYDIQFFPEGGNLVEGGPSVVAVKAVDETGAGINVEGDIVDGDKKTIAHFQTGLFGMGRFEFNAPAGKQYKAYVRAGGNQLTVADFPAVSQKGYSLKVIPDQNNQITISVFSNYERDSRPLYILIHTRGIAKRAETLSLVNGKGSITIQKSILGEGISTITLFSANRQPVCERLVFKMPAILDISAQAEMEEYQTRKKITAHIHLNNNKGDSSITNLGLSVCRIDSLQTEVGPDIRCYLYLSSDIRGYIEHPEYYFNHTGEQAEIALDNLMLTQGWRRFKWEEVLQYRLPDFEYIPEWTGHLINTKVTNRITGQPLENQVVYLAGPGIKSQLAGCVSNKKGQLLFDLPHLLGSNVVVLQIENRDDSNYRLDVANPFSEKNSGYPFPEFKLREGFKNDLRFYNVSTQVQNVYSLSSLIKFRAPLFRDSSSFYGEPDKKFYLDDYTRFNSMEEVVREYITGMSVHKRQNRFYFRILNDQQKRFFDQDPLIVLDGVPIFDATEVMNIDPLRIKKIEIVNRKFFLGSVVASGIFALYSYNNDMAGLQLNSRALILEYEGLQLQREFYSPKYDNGQTGSKRLPDFRNVLAWEPNIEIGKSGEAQISFYSSDSKGKYMGIVEGLNQNGLAGSTRFFFEVE